MKRSVPLTLAAAVCLGCLALAAPAGATDVPLGLLDCIVQAQGQSTQVAQTKELQDWEQAKTEAAFRRFLPQVDLTIAHQPKVDYFGRPIEDGDSYSNEVKVTQPVYTGGVLSTTHDQAKQGVRKVPLQRNKAALEVALQVVPGYFDLLAARRVGELRAGLLAGSREQVEIARRGLELGHLRREDILEAQARLAEITYDAAAAQGKAREAAHRLKEIMGLGRDLVLAIRPQEPAYRPPAESQAALELAVRQNPGLVFARAEEVYRELGLNLARAKDSSRVNLVGSLATEGDSFPGPEKNYVMGLVWEIPLGDSTMKAFFDHERQFVNEVARYFENQSFERKGIRWSLLDGSSRAPDIAESAYLLRKARDEVRDGVRELRTRILELYEELTRQEELLELARQQVALNQERVAVARAMEETGRLLPDEMLKRRKELTDAETKAAEAGFARAKVLATLCLLSGEELNLKDTATP